MKINENVKIGHYEIIRQIGAGGMGEVYRARDKRLGRQAAKLSVSRIVGAGDSRNRKYPKTDAETWLFRRRINK